MAKPMFAEYIGKYQIKAIEFDNLTLGTLPPTICGKFLSNPIQYSIHSSEDWPKILVKMVKYAHGV